MAFQLAVAVEGRYAASGVLVMTYLSIPDSPQRRRRDGMGENDHPKGALVFMLVYLVLLALLWTNMYFKLWNPAG